MPAQVRTRAFSVFIFLIHALGDAISPYIIGFISDQTGIEEWESKEASGEEVGIEVGGM